MIQDKRDIILSEGVPVEVTDLAGNTVPTIALLGRASRQSNAIITLEAHRRGNFLPEIEVDSGDLVHNTIANENYLVVGQFKELIHSEVAAIVAHMVLCNTKLTVSSIGETVNERGDIVQVDLIKTDGLDVFVQYLNSSVRQQMPGLFLEAEYLIYAPAIDVELLDKVSLTAGARNLPLKVVHLDYITYPGVVLVQACTETRT